MEQNTNLAFLESIKYVEALIKASQKKFGVCIFHAARPAKPVFFDAMQKKQLSQSTN